MSKRILKARQSGLFRTRGLGTARLDAQSEPACGTGGVRCA